ncbi:ATP synthase F0 subunit B [Bacillus sp. JJ1764]|uniref:ATP synthase F0 subunit B n=1 Tax=Bacillus sp. JJ1764 TaxID=3122964 RepID=UPI00300008D4
MGDLTLFGLPVSLGTMLYQASLFTVLVFILKKLVFKKMVGVLEKRKQHIEHQLSLTEQYKKEAIINLEASEEILKSAKLEAWEIRKLSEKEAKLILHSAKEEAKCILKEAKEEAYHSQPLSFTPSEKMKGA